MLTAEAFERVAALMRTDPPSHAVFALGQQLLAEMNPHPGGQSSLNVPWMDGRPLPGMQHKYRETVLFFPAQGQYCHSFCTFCFRWAQFVGKGTRFASRNAKALYAYLARHKAVTDLLLTGGDPMVMRTRKLVPYLAPLLTDPGVSHVQTVRIGTKALSYWPYRFVTDDDADELLTWLRRLANAGKHVAVMVHLNHWREMDTPIFEEAVRRIQATGAIIRTQAPMLRHINDDPEVWVRLWQRQVRLGMVPYYLFVERDTGAKRYFQLPLARAHEIYRQAVNRVSGLARTVRGPSMSAGPGKVEIQGVAEVAGERLFVLRFIQGRNPDWVQRPFFARYDEQACWLDQLRPAFGDKAFFWQAEYDAFCHGDKTGTEPQLSAPAFEFTPGSSPSPSR